MRTISELQLSLYYRFAKTLVLIRAWQRIKLASLSGILVFINWYYSHRFSVLVIFLLVFFVVLLCLLIFRVAISVVVSFFSLPGKVEIYCFHLQIHLFSIFNEFFTVFIESKKIEKILKIVILPIRLNLVLFYFFEFYLIDFLHCVCFWLLGTLLAFWILLMHYCISPGY